MNLYSSNQSIITYRRYIKIPDILAFVGGILKLINLLFYHINLKFSQVIRDRTVIDNLFDIAHKNNLNSNNSFTKRSKTSNDLELGKINKSLRTKESIIKGFTKDNDTAKKLKFSKDNETTKRLKFTMLDYFIIICNLKSKNRKDVMVYNKAKFDIRKYFDMLTIIKNILDFEFYIKNLSSKGDQEKINKYRPSMGLKPDNIIVESFNGQLNESSQIDSNNLKSLSPIHPSKV